MHLPGEVGAVADPHGVGTGAELRADLEALEIVLDGLVADRLVGVTQAAELVGVLLSRLILEGIGVGGVDEQAPGRRKRLQLRRALGAIPRNVQGHAGRDPHETKDRLAVLELLEDRLWFAGRRKPSEARTAGGQRPGRYGDAKRHREIGDHLDRDAAPRELLAEMRVVIIQGRAAALVVLGDAFVGQWEAHDVSAQCGRLESTRRGRGTGSTRGDGKAPPRSFPCANNRGDAWQAALPVKIAVFWSGFADRGPPSVGEPDRACCAI